MTTKPYFMGSDAQFRMFLSDRMGDEILQLVGFLEERAGCLWRSERLEEAYRIGVLALQLAEFTGIEEVKQLEGIVKDCLKKMGRKPDAQLRKWCLCRFDRSSRSH
jgi:hypothetical protein